MASVFLISAAALGYEILLTRIFAIVHWHHLVAITISLALLGYGASGSFLVALGDRLQRHFHALYVANALLFSISSLLCVGLAQRVPFDPQALTWDLSEIINLAIAFLLLAVPFFAAANCIGAALTRYRHQIPRIYGADLVGAGVGALLLLAGLAIGGPDRLLVVIALAGIAAAVSAAAAFDWHTRKTLAAGLTLLVALVSFAEPQVIPAPYKDLSRALAVKGASVDREYSGIAGTVTVVDNKQVPARMAPGMSLQARSLPPTQLETFLDGEGIGAIPDSASGAVSTLYLGELISALPYDLAHRPTRVAILNAGTGLHVRQALMLTDAHITAVEANPQIVDLVCGQPRHRRDRICDEERVTWQLQSARSFLSADRGRFDLIGLVVNADAAALDALSVDYSASHEAMALYLAHLTEAGLLTVEGPTRTPPQLSLRILNTAIQAVKTAYPGADPGAHIAMIRGWNRFLLLISAREIDGARQAAIRAFSRRLGFDLVWLPGLKASETNQYQQLASPLFYLGARRLLAGTDDGAGQPSRYRLQAISDDRPYPNLSTRWSEVVAAVRSETPEALAQLDTGFILAIVTLAVVTGAAVLLIITPLVWLQIRRYSAPSSGHRLRTLAYFSLIGIAFLFMEMAWIQRLQLFLGHPVYATTAVLAAFLLFAGAGSLWCQQRSADNAHRRLIMAVLVIGISGLAYLYWLAPGLARLADQAIWFRIPIAILLLAPLAFAMGIPFPSALHHLSTRAPALVPWAWGINGCASVVAAAAAPLVGSQIGFSGLTIAAIGAYLLLPLIGLTRQAGTRDAR